MKQRRSTQLLLRFLLSLMYWAASAHAFQSKLKTSGSILNQAYQSTEQALNSVSRNSSPQKCLIFASPLSFGVSKRRQLQFRACSSVALRHYPVERSPAVLSELSSSTGFEVDGKKRSILARFRRALFSPLRFLVLSPLKLLAEVVVDDLDGDGTVTVVAAAAAIGEASLLAPNDNPTAFSQAGETTIEDVSNQDLLVETVTLPPSDIKRDNKATDIDPAPLAWTKTSSASPNGERWAVSRSDVDLTGNWQLIVGDEFKRDYDRYLANFGQPVLVRSVALGIVGRTTEEIKQTDNGKSLLIRGRNVRGVWDRTLVASGTDADVNEYTPMQIPVMTADSEQVEAESWWGEEGTVHVSWLRGVAKYGGGDFESRRYLDADGKTYVCESIFHPNDESKEPNSITWRFHKQASNIA